MTLEQRLDLLMWLALHDTPRPLEGHPGWYLSISESVLGPYAEMALRHEDGRAFTFRMDFMNPAYREARAYDAIAAVELHRLYPDG